MGFVPLCGQPWSFQERRMPLKSTVLVAAVALASWACGDGGAAGAGAAADGSEAQDVASLASGGGDRNPVGMIGGPFPEYAAPTLDGDTVAVSELRGKVVFLNVWATWCPPCRREMPSLQALHQDLADQGLRIVGVSIDAAGDEEKIRAFLDTVGVTYLILHDPEQRIDEAMPIVGIPHTFLIGRDGTFLKQWFGEIDGTSPEVVDPVRDALAAAAAAVRARTDQPEP